MYIMYNNVWFVQDLLYYKTNKFVAETEVHYAENNALN